jgi:hypothetical protein
MILQAEQQQTARHAGRVHMNGFARPMDNIEKWITSSYSIDDAAREFLTLF